MGTTSDVVRGNAGSMQVIGLALAPAQLAANTSAEQTFLLPGVEATAIIGGVSFLGAMAAATGIVNARMVSAGLLGITFSNSGAGTPTPTAGTFAVTVIRPNVWPLPVNGI
ncbi:MAG: hypothetical protein IT325_09860 [Anaerolineae bacterium]|nr:hypothetical protein [Anaerolineae bacterium]